VPTTDTSLHWLTLRFNDRSLEKACRAQFSAEAVNFGRFALTMGAGFVSGFGLLDLYVAGDAVAFNLAVRFGVMLPAVLLGLFSLYLPGARRRMTVSLVAPVLVAGVSVTAMVTQMPAPAAHQYYAGVLVVILFGYTLAMLNFVHGSLVAAALILVHGAAVLWLGIPEKVVVSNLFFLISASLVGMIGAYMVERHRRRLFCQRLELERLSRELEHQAIRDPLTGLHNRREMEARLREVQGMAARYDLPAATALIDLDDFKRVNDEAGHAVGDRFLRTFAVQVTAEIRETDHAFRYGGDEFLVIFPNTTLKDARPIAKRLVGAGKRVAAEFGMAEHGVGCSVGLAQIRPEDDDCLERVDQALYAAKRAGRGRIVVVDDEDDSH
jgi:diguanylate cyclase